MADIDGSLLPGMTQMPTPEEEDNGSGLNKPEDDAGDITIDRELV